MSILSRAVVKAPLRVYQATCISVRNRKKEQEELPHYIEHATGLERKELLARAAGNDDPFGMKVVKRGPGTKDQPNLVPSFLDKRIVGCICEEDSSVIKWIWVHKDDPKRCSCGHWFKIVEAKPFY